jgi:hypothetical protein
MSMDTCAVFMLKVVARSVALGIKIRRSTYGWTPPNRCKCRFSSRRLSHKLCTFRLFMYYHRVTGFMIE